MLGPQENVTLVVRETLNILLSQLLRTKQLGVYPLPPFSDLLSKGESCHKTDALEFKISYKHNVL